MKFLPSLILALTLSFIPFKKVLAISQFTTNYNLTYTVLPDGLTQVTYEIDQTNNLSAVYAKNFSLSLSENDVQNIRVVDTSGELYPNITKTKNLTLISFDFKGKVAGRGKTNHFSISYQTKDIASKIGSVWEINIPRLVTDETAASVAISLIVPKDLGEPAYISPPPDSVKNNVYTFDLASLANRPISAVFGQEQFFEFKLYYNLKNPKNSTAKMKVALPPDTGYQKVYYQKLDPPPQKIETDINDNWIATFKLKPKQSLRFKAEGVAKITMIPNRAPLKNKDYYSKQTSIWPINDPLIKQELKNLDTVKSIYDYVVGSLGYDYSRLNKKQIRPGAIFALKNKSQSICTEFTDLFIALARAKGIPAREVQGFAYSTNEKLRPLSLEKDILHAWPEYYDETRGSWIQLDPTWGNTTAGVDYFNKLDLNHFAFAIHGDDVNDPLPAGAYKAMSPNSKDVYVKPTKEVTFPQESLEFEIISLIPKQATLLIKNKGPIGSQGELVADNGATKQTFNLSLAPWQESYLKVPLKSNSNKLTLSYNDKKYQFNLSPQGILKTNPFLAALVVFAIATLAAGYLYFSRRKNKPPLHW